MAKDQREIQRKLRILRHLEETGHVARTCRYFGTGRSSFYRWRQAYAECGEAGLINAPPIPKWHANRTPPEREDKVLYRRRKYHLGPIRIVWYLERYHGIQKHPDADRSGVSTNDPLTSTLAQRILLMKKITILRPSKA